jgi:hypothetical protein
MPLISDWKLSVTTDQVLRAQGADPEVIRSRRPTLVSTAEWALAEGLPLLTPTALYLSLPVRELRHERIYLDIPGAQLKDSYLSSALLASQLGGAEQVAIAVCTIGEAVETIAGELMNEDLLKGLALDAVGSAAVEALGNAVCAYLENQAVDDGLQATLPLSPGMIEWPVSEGQSQIFQALESEQRKFPDFQIQLSPSFVMLPRKSVSFVMGFGAQVNRQGRTCDFCAMKETCRYQQHYA